MKFILFNIVFQLIFSVVKAQEIKVPTFADPSPGNEMFAAPDVAAFHKYNFLPTDLYTGRVKANIPIYEINTGFINIPISINYNSGGIKVDDIASSVGLGWNLNAGGNILRVIRDIDDRKYLKVYYQIPDDTGDNAGTGECKVGLRGYHQKFGDIDTEFAINETDKTDSSPDSYVVNAPGLSNEFYLEDLNPSDVTTGFKDRTYGAVFLRKSDLLMGSMQRTALQLPGMGFSGSQDGNPFQSYGSYPIQTESVHNIPFNPQNIIKYYGGNPSVDGWYYKYDFDAFSIKNNQGLVYSFTTKNFVATYNLPILDWMSQFTNYDTKISSWNLESITDPVSSKSVQFIYETYTRAIAESFHNFTGRNPLGFDSDDCFLEHMSYNSSSSYDKELYANETLVKYPELQRLKKIKWTLGTVEFEYGLVREDVTEETALTQIVVKNFLGEVIKKYTFEYSYFISKEGCAEPECKRLKLDKINELSTDETSTLTHELEYYYDNPLPKRNSLQKDYLGYYNNNGSAYSFNEFYEQAPSPTLYFYPDQGIYSILPFQKKSASTFRKISGDYSLEPNNNSLTALLKKITYPNGGFSSFEYENQKFQFEGQEYLSGGARIKKQTINTSSGQERTFNYAYEENGLSSGYINNIPVFGYPNTYIDANITLSISNNDWKQYFTTYDKSRSGLELTQGNFIGYSKIIETETGNGYTEYNYTSPKEYPNIHEQRDKPFAGVYTSCQNTLIVNSAFPGINFINKEIRRGNLTSKKIFNESNQLLNEVNNRYDYKIYSTLDLVNKSKIISEMTPIDYPEANSFNIYSHSAINIERNVLIETTAKDYLDDGIYSNTQSFIYDEDHSQVKEIITVNSDSSLNKTKFSYVFDFDPSYSAALQDLHDKNRLGALIDIKKFNDENKIETQILEYEMFSGVTSAQPHKVLSSKGKFSLEEKVEYVEYNNKGNILEYSKTNNVHTSIIWGYNQTYPVAQISNATYAQVESALGVGFVSGTDGSEGLSDNQIDLLRTLPNVQVTTYTYKPVNA